MFLTRIAYALTEVRKYLIPDSNDEIRQTQMREMEIIRWVGSVKVVQLFPPKIGCQKSIWQGILDTMLAKTNTHTHTEKKRIQQLG